MSKKPLTKSHSDSHKKSSESFLLETKYVVLNFMGLPPTDLSDNLTSSQTSYASEHRKTSSYPQIQLPPSRKKELPSKTRAKQITEDADSSSPFSSSSQYRYPPRLRKYLTDSERKEETASTKDKEKEVGIPVQPDCTQSASSPSYFPSVSQTQSEISDDQSSYCGDADDEAGSTSNCSSTLGSRCSSGEFRHSEFGAGDLLHAISKLPTVVSESELEKEDGDQDTSPLSIGEVSVLNFNPTSPFSNVEGDGSIDLPTNNTQHGNNGETGDWDFVTGRTFVGSTSSFSELATLNGLESEELVSRGIGNRANLHLDLGGQQTWEMLQTELQDEFSSLESEVEDAIRNHVISSDEVLLTTPLSPQSEVARKIAHIGDEVRMQYGSQLDLAITNLFTAQAAAITYDSFRSAASFFLDDKVVELKQECFSIYEVQVALVLVFSQKVAWKLLESGQKGFGNFGDLVDYSAQLIADYAADYIINQGGWAALSSSDHTSSSPSTTPEISSPFNRHINSTVIPGLTASSTHPLASTSPLMNKESKAIAKQIGKSLSVDQSKENNNNYPDKQSFTSTVSEFIQNNKLNLAMLSLVIIIGVYVIKKRKV